MASSKKKLVMMVVSTILIPLGTFLLKKIVTEITGKLDSRSSEEEKDTLMHTTQ